MIDDRMWSQVWRTWPEQFRKDVVRIAAGNGQHPKDVVRALFPEQWAEVLAASVNAKTTEHGES